MTVPVVSPGLVVERARSLVGRGRDRVLLLRSAPEWQGPPSLMVEGHTVHVRPGPSQLAVLSAYLDLPDGDYLVVLTDRPERDLGDAVLVRAAGRTVERPDDWDAVAGMTGAQTVDPGLRRLGRWAASALLDHRPEKGWPAAASDVLLADEALGWLLARLLGQPVPTVWDPVRLVEVLNTLPARSAWAAIEDTLRRHLVRWAEDAFGPQARLALMAAQTTPVSVVALGLAMDVLWPVEGSGGDNDQILARGRLEKYVGGAAINPAHARALAMDARDIAVRMDDAGEPDLPSVLVQAEKLLADVGWPTGARQSDILTAGLVSRLEDLAGRITAHLDHPGSAGAVERALGAVVAHRFAHRDSHEVDAARMATRLVRWLAVPGKRDLAVTLGGSLQLQVDDGGWVDRAVAAIWTGSEFGAVAAAYQRLASLVLEIRGAQHREAAAQLAAATAADEIPAGVVPVERLLHDVVRLGKQVPVLLVVLDGMSMRVATEIAQGAADRGWIELLPEGRNARLPGLAVLPTVTAFSRTSLLCGELVAGIQATEKSRFRDVTGGPVFHKDDLRSGAGDLLPDAVVGAIKDPAIRVVGAVLNTIDDSLAKDDPDGTVWDLERVRHLRALLNAATLAGRVVVLTADHGHVVERGGTPRPTSGADARWRPVATGPAGADEVVVRGSRVLASGGEAILAVDEGLRYGVKTAGYHGGACLAEITVPILVLDRALRTVKGWSAAPPQTPAWWNDPVFSVVEEKLATQTKRATRRAPHPAPDSFDALLPELTQTVPASEAEGSLVDRLPGSGVYAAQRRRAGRHALDDDVVRVVLAVLLARGGRAHRETVAAAAGVAEGNLEPKLAALRRLLNVEGYPVLGEDPDGVTVVLDEKLLVEQFELGR